VDVAALAGVSIGTASKALNGQGKLREETRGRVLEAAERLGFEPNALARSLLAGRSFTVGLLTTDSFGRFSIPVMLGAENALGDGRMSVFLCDARDDVERERRYLRTLLSRQVDGIIVAGRRVDPRPPIGTDLPVPVVYAMTQSTDPRDVSVIPDDEGGGRLAMEHLLAKGRTRIAHVTGPRRFAAVQRRARGAVTALADAGLRLAGGSVLYGSWSEEWGRQAVGRLIARRGPLEGIFCGSDQIARGAADALREAGRSVPADIALVGFDNWDVMAAASRPTLTTVDPNLTELGRAAASELLAAMDGPTEGGVRTIPCRLVQRESTPEPQLSELSSSLSP
jgi:LacI family transcriptional regulator